MTKKVRRTGLLWGLIAAHLLFTTLNSLFGIAPGVLTPAISVPLIVAITTLHALGRYTLSQFLVFAAICFVVSNGYENLSILTGFPFGDYYYSDLLGPKLFLVPLLIAPAYFGVGYLAWSIAHILLGLYESRPKGSDIVVLPVIASLIAVMWDMIMDPGNATIRGSWIWEDGGSYFGVPFSNYLGWILCLYTIFQLFALYLAWTRPKEEPVSDPSFVDRGYWAQAIVPYFAMSVPWVLRMFTGTDSIVTDPAGQQWHTMHIFESTALVAIFTMHFVCLLSAATLARVGRRT